jgi:hypothetical protein
VSFARVAVLALALIHGVGLAERVRQATCAEMCDDDDDGCPDGCGPSEASCRCHAPAAAQLVAPAAITVSYAAPPVAVAVSDAGARAHASPDPREILHVPRLAA